MFSENHYRPLPKEVIIKQSEIDGYGIFAKEDISKECHRNIYRVYQRKNANLLPGHLLKPGNVQAR